MVSCSFAALVVAAAALAAQVQAHSYMIDPMPTWPVSWATNQFAATIAGQTYLPCPDGMSYQTDPLLNTEAYWTAFNDSTYTSLKDLVDQTGELQTLSPFGTATLECGFSLANGTARDLPAEYVEWVQLTNGHDGPCEVWCDDVLAFQDDNCAVNYPDSPSQWPYDVSKCSGASQLTSYWIALHGLPWQVYINCAPLTGSVNSTTATAATSTSSGSATTTTTTTTTTTAPATTTATPTATTATTTTTAPATTTATPTATTATTTTTTTTTAPVATTATPATTTAASTTTASSTAAEADESDCGSLDVAGSDESDCGSLDVAGSESDCGSLDVAGDADDESTSTTSTSTSSTTTESPSTSTTQSTGTSTSTSTSTTSTTTSSASSEVAGDADSEEVAGDADTGSYTTEDDSECGSLEMAETDDSECGSLEMAETDDSECGSLEMAESDESECGSLEMAESTESDAEYTGSETGIDFSTLEGSTTAGTVSPEA
ncbi:hypothetical protein BBJ28_00004239 [Nothophytophthora sp. Chile5]|nr:hypothetical protein BBJ28_00004239 [Nothophytophthora sp. Chile5]